ncbi:MAG: YdcF family protein [Patescibacteria group bacterium]
MPLSVDSQFDVVIVLGSSFVNKDGQYNLGFLGKVRALAASELLKRKISLNLVLTGGKTKGKHEPSEAAVMFRFLKKENLGKSNLKNVFLEKKAKETSDNIKNSIKLCEKNRWNKVAFLSNEFHRRRVEWLIKSYRLRAQFVSAEAILRQFGDKDLIKKIEDYDRLLKVKLIKALEVFFCLLLFFDKRGEIGKFTARIFRR